VADIGLPAGRTRHEHVTEQILKEVPRRGSSDNKYTAGSVLVVGGSTGKTGAPCLTAEAALRAGAGIVTVCVPASLNLVFEQRLLEVMSRPCADEDGVMTMDAADAIVEAAEKATAVAIGPGIGRTDAVRALIGYLLDRLDKPIVLDADGLWAVASPPRLGLLARCAHGSHATCRRARRLLGLDSSAVSARRLKRGADGCPTTWARSFSQGRGHAGRVSRQGRPSSATSASRARDGRHGGRSHPGSCRVLSKGMGARWGAAAAAARVEAARLAARTHGSAGMIARRRRRGSFADPLPLTSPS
jgi:NAD(P)H-hydrate epimerase